MPINNDGYIAELIENLPQFSVKKLCEIIIVARYLGSMNEEAIRCMEELNKRREAGNTFDYEEFISSEAKKLPEFKIDLRQKMNVGFDLSGLKGKI